jgi:hypothetical protein
MTSITELLWKGLQFILENPEKALLFAVVIIATFLVKPIHLIVSSVWGSIKLLITKPSAMLLWLVLLALGLILLKEYGVF